MTKIINVKVIPQAKKNVIKEESEIYKVYLTAPAVDGKANSALILSLSGYFNVKKRQVEIIKGLRARKKVVKIIDDEL